MKFTYVGVAERKTIELSPGSVFVMEKGVSVEVPDALAEKLNRTPGYRRDSAAVGPKFDLKDEKSDAKADKAADKAKADEKDR
jgi:hypothetical protein